MKRVLAGFLFLSAMLSAFVIAFVFAMAYDAKCPLVFESKSIFQISPNWIADDNVSEAAVTRLVEFCDQPHEDLIASPAMIEDCLIKNNLLVLDAFRDVDKEDAALETAKNLSVKKLDGTSNVYELVYQCSDPNDTQTILNNLVETYRSHLETENPEVVNDYRFRLHESAQYGEQVSPILPWTLAKFVLPIMAVVALLWFLINPFKFDSPGLGVMDPFIWLVATSLFAAIMVGSVFVTKEPEYECSAKVQFNDSILEATGKGSTQNLRLAVLNKSPHDVLIRQYNHIDQVLDRNNLYVLDCFEDFAKEDCMDNVQQSLKFEPDPASPNTLKIRYRSYDKLDSMAVLNNLIRGYSFQLKKEHQKIAEQHQARSNEAASSGKQPADHGVPVQYTVAVIEAAEEGQPAGFEFTKPMLLAIGIIASVLGTIVWLTRRATMTNPEKIVMAEFADQ